MSASDIALKLANREVLRGVFYEVKKSELPNFITHFPIFRLYDDGAEGEVLDFKPHNENEIDDDPESMEYGIEVECINGIVENVRG